jgi:hypothetical protein
MCFCFQFFFSMKIEGTFKLVGKNKSQGIFLFLLLVLKKTKLTSNSTNAKCNISNNNNACVEIRKAITHLRILNFLICFNTRAHKLSRCSRATTKFNAPKCRHEESTILTVDKFKQINTVLNSSPLTCAPWICAPL